MAISIYVCARARASVCVCVLCASWYFNNHVDLPC